MCPVGLEAFHGHIFQALAVNKSLSQLAQPFTGDHAFRGSPCRRDHRGRGLDGAARPHGILPAQAKVGALDVGQFRECCEFRAAHAFLVDLPIGEEALAVGDAAHAKAFQGKRFELLADDQLRGATADIDDQAAAVLGQRMGRPQVDQAGLLPAGNDLDALAEKRFRAFDEGLAVGGIAQGVGADHANLPGRDVVEKG